MVELAISIALVAPRAQEFSSRYSTSLADASRPYSYRGPGRIRIYERTVESCIIFPQVQAGGPVRKAALGYSCGEVTLFSNL